MARRAQEAARCPWCQVALDQRATECPACLLPLTMAAVDTGRSGGRPAGTSSTASTGSTPASPLYRVDPHRLPPSGRAHRLRMAAWLLALTSAILLVAGIASWITVSDPDVQADVTAKFDLSLALARAQGTDTRTVRPVTLLAGGDASDQPDHLSVQVDGREWYAAAQSTSGRCFVLAAILDSGGLRIGGPLGKGAPCTGLEVRNQLGQRLRDTRP